MKPVIALVGRPNVGKSTLFNQLTRSRDALVADMPGLTRDRQYGVGRVGEFGYMVVDTGGLSGEAETLDTLMARQTLQAIQEADVVLFLVDGREGLSAADQTIAEELRGFNKQLLLVLNKTDGIDANSAATDFFSLGLGTPVPIAAAHGRGVSRLMDRVKELLPEAEARDEDEERWPGIRIAFVGRPNAGKSTLINRILGEERVLATDVPGTTRDSVYVPFERDEQMYTLIDTAGVRRRSRVHETVEKFSVVKTLQAVEAAHVVIFLLDARQGIAEQDAHLLGMVMEAGRSLVLAINKWDGLTPDDRDQVRMELSLKLPFLDFAERRFISALHGSGVGDLFGAVQRAHESASADVSTSLLTRLLERAISEHQPPLVRGRRIKLRYAHQGGRNPPVIVIHGNQTDQLPGSYKRYLTNYFRQHLQLVGTPIRMEFRTGENPYKDKRNTLTPRQQHKRKRMMRHVKKKGR
ncbi:ribosome biogenesis GTPase Der [Ectothiorhodospira sp. BSL-9]|uniref:ribosome biogenesis GTPase Der n=1 Tax=Ectothiorhodospira sp. BSL-9 TaxID=1442136 RepID=UPI0007B43D30|nr:ribosome biogenesis GTPase Der [Ectothiorhodospira sp. BSL-9]ANB03506.1 GTPase Der [Ectothiorhodospira sp. BSL-9]TVQ75135.1 MAG: ribosome biogenesis GTPase Der [Chromatiaceae bacterium]